MPIPTNEELQAQETSKVLNINALITEALDNLTDGEILDIRYKLRSINGSVNAIPFSGSATANTSTTLVSKQIQNRFTIEEIRSIFPSGTTNDVKIYVYVSDDATSTANGDNLLSQYSNTPYLIGDGVEVIAKTNPKEFQEGKYIKVEAINTNSSTNYEINVIVRIKVYPITSQATG